MHKFLIPLLAVSLFSLANANDTVTKRQQLMKQLGGIGKQFSDGVDVATANKLGGDMQRIANELKTLFPKGTSEDEVKTPANGAKAKIWAESDKVMAIFDKLAQNGGKIATAKTMDEAGAIFKANGGETCKACHDVYRTKL